MPSTWEAIAYTSIWLRMSNGVVMRRVLRVALVVLSVLIVLAAFTLYENTTRPLVISVEPANNEATFLSGLGTTNQYYNTSVSNHNLTIICRFNAPDREVSNAIEIYLSLNIEIFNGSVLAGPLSLGISVMLDNVTYNGSALPVQFVSASVSQGAFNVQYTTVSQASLNLTKNVNANFTMELYSVLGPYHYLAKTIEISIHR